MAIKKDSRTFKSTRNSIFSIALSFATLLFNYLSRIIFVKFLDPSYLGINGLFADIISVLSLADLGVATAMMFSLYKPIREKNHKQLILLVRFFKKVYLIIAGCVLVIGLSLIPALPYIVNLPSNIPGIVWYYVLFVIQSVCSYLFIYRTTLLNADQKNYIANAISALFEFLKFIIRVLTLILFKSYLIYFLIGISSSILCNFVKNQITLKIYPFLKEKPSEKLPKDEAKIILNNTKSTFIYKLSNTVINNVDSILISIFVGTITVGYYSNYLMVVNGVIGFINLLFGSLYASVASFIAEKDNPKDKYDLFIKMESLNLIVVGFSSVCFSCLFNDFILFSFGKEYLLSLPVLFAIILNFYTYNIKQNTAVFRETGGVFRQVRFVPLITAIINLILSLALGFVWGLFGILFATSISRLIYAWWREPQIMFRTIFKKKSGSYLINTFVSLFLTFVICIVLYCLCLNIDFGSYFANLLVKAIVSVAFGLPIFVAWQNNGVSYFVTHFKQMVRKNGQ